ncbi:hypothetical protein J2S43_004056 [Catenuloplanes nepalensis]|uniref:Uncharacterized protein n=1 Tax=Catenuloplanes nepalensis TaxID=587533 RepID=A0ABT9MVY2_9ACTN|nr:hypothetical protein [Catenuloplanes nepalensis]MDP9795544.1 hypothetical protein [Catenuloplanes nepalensis]
MVDHRNNREEALRILEEASANPAGDRLIAEAQVRALLSVADEIRSLREALATPPGSPTPPATA